jgi:formate dehydrogenase iron-sulfur subunit
MDDLAKTGFSRRDFLKRLGFGAAAATAACLLPGGDALASETLSGPTWGMLIDLSRCSGCNSCALACKESNDLPYADIVPKALGARTYTFVEAYQVANNQRQIVTRYVKRQCMHCLDAACVSACPAAAMHNSGEGPVIYRADRCLGCRYCEVACPFGIPRFDWDNSITPRINKCWMCYERLKEGEEPACASACPTGAIHFGRREDLVAQAHARIASNPDRYVDHVFGESEVGGTSMLYISDVPFEQMGFATDLPVIAPPKQTEKILYKLPYVIAGMAAFMTGTAIYTHRKPTLAVPAEGKPALPHDEQEE